MIAKIKAAAMKVLVFLRLIDAHDSALSLTNLMMLVAVGKFALLKNISLPELTAFFVSVGAYVWKAHGKRKVVITEERIKAVEGAISGAAGKVEQALSAAQDIGKKVAALDNRTQVLRRPGGM